MKPFHHLGLLLAATIMLSAADSQALVCGPVDCTVAGETNDSPFNVGDAGDFASSVDVVTPTSESEMFNHAWTFTLNEPARIDGTLTNNNTRPAFNIGGLSLQLFSATDLANNIGGTFVVAPGAGNPFAGFTFSNLAAGDYFFKISGQLLASDGQYTSQFGVSQVPLPSAIWLFLTAILGWASVSRLGGRPEAD